MRERKFICQYANIHSVRLNNSHYVQWQVRPKSIGAGHLLLYAPCVAKKNRSLETGCQTLTRTSRILTWTDVKKSLLLESKATGNSRFESAKFLRQRKKNSRYRKWLVILCCDNCTRLTTAKRSRLGNSILLVKRHEHSGHKKC